AGALRARGGALVERGEVAGGSRGGGLEIAGGPAARDEVVRPEGVDDLVVQGRLAAGAADDGVPVVAEDREIVDGGHRAGAAQRQVEPAAGDRVALELAPLTADPRELDRVDEGLVERDAVGHL